MRQLVLVLILGLIACGGPDVAATATRETEVRQVATLTAATPTPTRDIPQRPTLSPLEITATALGAKQYATVSAQQQAAQTAGCARIADLYAQKGRVFDPVAAAANPQLALLDLHLLTFGTTDPVTTQLGQMREELDRNSLLDCIGVRR